MPAAKRVVLQKVLDTVLDNGGCFATPDLRQELSQEAALARIRTSFKGEGKTKLQTTPLDQAVAMIRANQAASVAGTPTNMSDVEWEPNPDTGSQCKSKTFHSPTMKKTFVLSVTKTPLDAINQYYASEEVKLEDSHTGAVWAAYSVTSTSLSADTLQSFIALIVLEFIATLEICQHYMQNVCESLVLHQDTFRESWNVRRKTHASVHRHCRIIRTQGIDCYFAVIQWNWSFGNIRAR